MSGGVMVTTLYALTFSDSFIIVRTSSKKMKVAKLLGSTRPVFSEAEVDNEEINTEYPVLQSVIDLKRTLHGVVR